MKQRMQEARAWRFWDKRNTLSNEKSGRFISPEIHWSIIDGKSGKVWVSRSNGSCCSFAEDKRPGHRLKLDPGSPRPRGY